jgi:hypothetical protein
MTEVENEAPARRARRGYFGPAIIAMAVLLAIAAAVGAGDLAHPAPTKLNGLDVESEIALGLQVEQRWATPPVLACPPQEPTRAGLTFTCSVNHGGQNRTVTVTELDGRGHLSWQLSGS